MRSGHRRARHPQAAVTGQHSAPTVVAPVCVRLGVLGLVAAPAAIGLYQLVDRASSGSWLHGH
ncbi:DUF6336 family protein [Streptomyces sp. NPDC005813]|uniref:DUF6336 family protein n=1 Tax=Streptomyces sp. NPDC005813 TaxID=3155592 RepID=UPI0033F61D66